jgi:hypothetical protein
MYLGYQNGQIKFYTEKPLDLILYSLDSVEETQDEYVLDGENYVLKDEAWEEKQALIEKERIARLSCTKRDFALMLQEMGVDYFTQLKPLIDSNPQAQLEWELCERLYRFNPMIDLMAGQLGVTPEMLDGLFQYANGEITASEFEALIPKEEEDESTTDIQEDTDATA